MTVQLWFAIICTFLQKLFKDYLMILFVLSLAIIDVIILLPYTVTEAVNDNLGVKLTSNRELPYKTFGVIIMLINFSDPFKYLNFCSG